MKANILIQICNNHPKSIARELENINLKMFFTGFAELAFSFAKSKSFLYIPVGFSFCSYGKIILQPGCFAHFDKIVITDKQKKALDELHKEKILMSDCIYVINENNYIGDSTKTEIEFAMNNNIPIFYYNPI